MKLLKSVELDSYEDLSSRLQSKRKLKTETKIRSLFIGRGSRQFPKKEYIRCKLIRGHKRLLRTITETYPTLSESSDTLSSSSKLHYWSLLVKSYLQYPETFQGISPIEVGPVNQQMKKRKIEVDHLERSFNTIFCQEYFSKAEIRESYNYYVEYIFSKLDCEKLIKRFGFRCCDVANHENGCYFKWAMLKRYCQKVILEDIRVSPFEKFAEWSPLPCLGLLENNQ